MVKRYEVSEKYIGTGEYVGQMVACSDGDYVEFSDYDDLAARLAEAERQLTLVLPLAKGYAAAHRVGANAEIVAGAEDFLRPADSADEAPRRTPSGLCTHDDSSWCTDECRGSTVDGVKP